MKKTTIALLASGLLFVSGLKAQTIQEGINHLYADRFKSATGVFEKLLATNPNNIEAIYWLGQTYFDMDDNTKARQLYEKALTTNGSAPLILVGLGHSDLLENKTNDARQKFEAAITAATSGKKGADPVVLTAIGRANVDAKSGDFNYAIEKLKTAAEKADKNTETLLQLGNAYRKARPGEGGGEAFQIYKKALEVDPAFAVASLRLAKLFESQKNWDLVLEYLNDAVKRDANFAPAYFELFYYNFFRAKFPEAEEQLNKFISTSDADISHEHLFAQLCWAKKDFDCATNRAEKVLAAMGDKTKPKVLKLLSDAYYQKGSIALAKKDSIGAMKEYVTAKKYIDLYFTREKAADLNTGDYKLLVDILNKTGGTGDEIMNAYVKGAAVDTVLSSKIDFLKQGASYFKTIKVRDKEGDLLQKAIELKPKPTINDHFDLTLARYFSSNYAQSRIEANTMIQKFPDQVYGYEWKFNSSNAIDTVKKDSIAVPDALELFAFAQKDTAKFRKQYLSSIKFLGAYYINQARDKEKALEFFTKWLEADPDNAISINQYIEQIKKMPATRTSPPARGNSPAPMPKTSATKTTSGKDMKPKTTTPAKKAAVKK